MSDAIQPTNKETSRAKEEEQGGISACVLPRHCQEDIPCPDIKSETQSPGCEDVIRESTASDTKENNCILLFEFDNPHLTAGSENADGLPPLQEHPGVSKSMITSSVVPSSLGSGSSVRLEEKGSIDDSETFVDSSGHAEGSSLVIR